MMNNSSTVSLVQVTVISSSSAAGVSSIACVIALGALLFFKMYRHFIYRLVLYTLVLLTIFSFSNMLFLILVYVSADRTVGIHGFILFLVYVSSYSYYSALMLMTCTIFYIQELALYNRLCNKWTYDFNCLLLSLGMPLIFITLPFVACNEIDYSNILPVPQCQSIHVLSVQHSLATTFNLVLMLVFSLNGIFIAGVTVPLCSRACGCRAMMWSVATNRSHRQALIETMPLLVLPIVSLTHTYLVFILHYVQLYHTFYRLDQLFTGVLGGILGLVAALTFAMHLCILGKTKRKKLRGSTKKRVHVVTYGTMADQHRTHRPTEYTTEGISETCNTYFPHVSEEDVDREVLIKQQAVT